MAGVHVSEPCRIAEGIDNARLRPAHPASVVGVVPVVDLPPADPGRSEARVGGYDRRGNRRRQPGRVGRIDAGSQTRKSCRGGVRVGRRNQHPLDRDAGLCRGKRLRLVDERLRHHAGVDDDQRQAHGLPPIRTAVIEDDRPDEERIVDAVGPGLQKPPGDDRRGFRRGVARRDVDRGRTGLEVTGPGIGTAGDNEEQAERHRSGHAKHEIGQRALHRRVPWVRQGRSSGGRP